MKKNITLIKIRRNQISFFAPIFRNILLLIVTITITEEFHIHFGRIT